MSLAALRLEIFGTTSDRIGPFALLGLTPERCEPHHVRTAVESLLARVDRHARSGEPVAADLRREIHAAAALLLDANIRGELIADYQQARRLTADPSTYALAPREPTARAVAASNGAPRGAGGSSNYSPAFLRDLLAAWVSAGGWNGKARHRIIAAGVQHGISGESLIDAILTMPATLAAPRATPLVGPPPVGMPGGDYAAAMLSLPASLSILAVRDDHEAAKRNLFAAVLAFLACAAVVIPFAAWVFIQINVMGPKPDSSLTTLAPAPIVPSNAGAAPSLPTVAREDIAVTINPMSQTLAGLLESLDRESTLATSLGEATLGLFTSATTQGRRQWTQLNSEARERLRDVLVSAVYRLGRDEPSARSLIDLIDPSESQSLSVESIAGQAWSVGMLAVMMREPDLPAAARQTVEGHWRRHVPTGTPPQSADFNAAARFALREMITPLVGTMATNASIVELWVAWLQCVTSVADDEQAEALALDSARQVLVDGPDISASDKAGRVMAAIFSAVRWKTSPAARAALLSWWDEPRVSPADLAVVSSWIVSTGAIPGLDDSFIIPSGASAEVRVVLRQKLAQAWSSAPDMPGDAPTTRAEIADWIARSERLGNESTAASPEAILAQTITVAYHNSAASMLWAGRPGDASRLLGEMDARIAAARLTTPPSSSPAAPANRGDGQWAIRYFHTSKENDRERLKRLVESLATEQPGDLGPIDAAVLADIALAGQPREMRAAALDQIVGAYSDGPTVLLALADKMIPDRSDPTLSQAIARLTGESLPELRSEDWYTRARLALIRRVANLRGALAGNSGVDALAELLAEVYGERLARSTGPSLVSPSTPARSPAEAAQQAFAQWIEVGRPMQPLAPLPAPLHQIEHRAAIRAAVLDDPIGRFHAWQIGSLEAACYVASAERPAARRELADLLSTTTLQLAVARNVMEQLLIAERALLKVWKIRFGAGTKGKQG